LPRHKRKFLRPANFDFFRVIPCVPWLILAVMLLAQTENRDVHRNLALEEGLLDRVAEHGPALFLWRSAGAVVLGKNQNPWREVNLAVLRAEDLALARRVSGGGTVFQDAGNLNYALCLPREAYDQDEVFDRLVRAFQRVGIPAVRGPHHGLLAYGRKFSGSAFCFRRRAALHHGTLLINANLERLHRVLTGGLALTTRAIASHPMPVVNLAELQPGCDVARVVSEAFAPGAENVGDEFLEALPWREAAQRHRTWAWQFGHTPPFEVKIGGLGIRVEHGRIAALTGNSACAAKLVGQVFQPLEQTLNFGQDQLD
jgi:lipoate-protein ligase A